MIFQGYFKVGTEPTFFSASGRSGIYCLMFFSLRKMGSAPSASIIYIHTRAHTRTHTHPQGKHTLGTHLLISTKSCSYAMIRHTSHTIQIYTIFPSKFRKYQCKQRSECQGIFRVRAAARTRCSLVRIQERRWDTPKE